MSAREPTTTTISRKRLRQETNPPVTRLYRHALESIFGFLSLASLGRVLAVSRSWSTAIGSMASIGAVIESIPVGQTLNELCVSGLARHIGTFGSVKNPVTIEHERLYMAGFRMTGLHTLYYNFLSYTDDAPRFPSSLTSLVINVSRDADLNRVIFAAGLVPNLVSLGLGWRLNPWVSFAPLLHAPKLRNLFFHGSNVLTPRQSDELRSIPTITELHLGLCLPDLRLLLRAPQQLQLHAMDVFNLADDSLADLTVPLRSLNRLCAYGGTSFMFLPSLSALCTLELVDFYLMADDPEKMIHGLGQCAQLTTIRIDGGEFTAPHISALLSRMPSIRTLDLADLNQLHSLSFLSAAPLSHTLSKFTLSHCREFAASELYHVFSLEQQLTSLELRDCCLEPLDSLTRRELTPPSRHLPKLTKSTIVCDP